MFCFSEKPCGDNMTFDPCRKGTTCNEYCKDKPADCENNGGDCKADCFCDSGFKKETLTSEKCIAASECPKEEVPVPR